MKKEIPARFLSKVQIDPNTGCWNWQRGLDKNGYGKFHHNHKTHRAHKWLYEYMNDQVPKGLELDHLCRNKACVNTTHLEAVTARTNILRGKGIAAINNQKTHCKHDHEFTKENTKITKKGKRKCRECDRIAGVKRYAKKFGLIGNFYSRRTHCKHGHEFSQENTRLKNNTRYCRACERIRSEKLRKINAYNVL